MWVKPAMLPPRAGTGEQLSIFEVAQLGHEFGLGIASEIGPVSDGLVTDSDMRS